MLQTLFTIPYFNIPVYGYGVMMVLGLICGMYVAQELAKRCGLDPELFANAAIIALVTGIIGARISHVLENLPHYTDPRVSVWQNFINMVNIRRGGLTYYGGFLFGTPILILYGVWHKVSIRLGMDIFAPCLMIGLAFGRIGCFLNGCCYGAECNVPWAVQFPFGSDAYVTQFDADTLTEPVPRKLFYADSRVGEYMDHLHLESITRKPAALSDEEWAGSLKRKEDLAKDTPFVRALAAAQHANPVHPAELYSTIVAFTIAGFLLCYFTLAHTPGRVFAAMLMIEGVFRYMLEIIRVEPPVMGRGTGVLTSLPPQSLSMVISFFLVWTGIGLWIFFGMIAKQRGETPALAGKPALAV